MPLPSLVPADARCQSCALIVDAATANQYRGDCPRCGGLLAPYKAIAKQRQPADARAPFEALGPRLEGHARA